MPVLRLRSFSKLYSCAEKILVCICFSNWLPTMVVGVFWKDVLSLQLLFQFSLSLTFLYPVWYVVLFCRGFASPHGGWSQQLKKG